MSTFTDQNTSDMANDQTPNKETIRQHVTQLAKITEELQRNHTLLASASNLIQAETMKQRVDELSRKQKSLMDQLISWHPDQEARERYHRLHNEIEALQTKIKKCHEIEELRNLEKEIEGTVEAWVKHFQRMAADLMGAAPPVTPS